MLGVPGHTGHIPERSTRSPCSVMDNLIGLRKNCTEATAVRYLRSSSTIRLATSRYMTKSSPLKGRSDTLQSMLVTYTSTEQGQGTYAPDHGAAAPRRSAPPPPYHKIKKCEAYQSTDTITRVRARNRPSKFSLFPWRSIAPDTLSRSSLRCVSNL